MNLCSQSEFWLFKIVLLYLSICLFSLGLCVSVSVSVCMCEWVWKCVCRHECVCVCVWVLYGAQRPTERKKLSFYHVIGLKHRSSILVTRIFAHWAMLSPSVFLKKIKPFLFLGIQTGKIQIQICVLSYPP